MYIQAILKFKKEYTSLKTPQEKQAKFQKFIRELQQDLKISINDRVSFLFLLKQILEPKTHAEDIAQLFTEEDKRTIDSIIMADKEYLSKIEAAQKNSTLLPEDLLNAYNAATNYGFNIDLYFKILPFAQLMYLDEKSGIPEEHAYKLAIMFGNEEAILKYLTCGVFDKSNRPFHDACLFSSPDSPPHWNIDAWRNLASKNNNLARDQKFKRLLKNAGKIEEYIFTNLKTELTNNETALNLLCEKEKIEKQSQQKEAITKLETKIKYLKELINLQEEIAALQASFAKTETGNENNQDQIRLQESKLKGKKTAFGNKKTAFIQNMTVVELNEIALKLTYIGAEKNPIIAALFQEYGLSQKDFDLALSLKPQDSDKIPNVTLLGKEIDEAYSAYYITKLNSADSRALVLGEMTGCCQSIGHAGQACTVEGITNPESGFYVICKGNGKSPKLTDAIVAQCWAWRGKNNGLVFDSIEYAKSTEEGKIANTDRLVVEMIQDLYTHLASKLVDESKNTISRVMVGASGNTPKSMGWDATGKSATIESFKTYKGYCDSSRQRPLASQDFPGYLYSHIKNLEQPDASDKIWLKKIEGWFKAHDKKVNEMLNIPPSGILQDWIATCIAENKEKILVDFKRHLSTENATKFETLVDNLHKMYLEQQKPIEKLDLPLIEKLVQQGISLDFTFKGQENLFMRAVEEKHLPTIDVLLKLGADFNTIDYNGEYLLVNAASTGQTEIVDLFLKRGADVNIENVYYKEPLIVNAVKTGQLAMVRLLLKHGANINTKDYKGDSLLICAMQQLASLISHKQRSNDSSIPAEYLKQVHFVKFLVDQGADVNAKGRANTTLLNLLTGPDWDIIEYFLDKGLDTRTADESNLFILLFNATDEGKLHIIKRLVNHNTNPEIKKAILFMAAESKQWEIVTFLIETGVDINAKDDSGESIFNSIVDQKAWDIAKIFLENPKLDLSSNGPNSEALKSPKIIELTKAQKNKSAVEKPKVPLILSGYPTASDEMKERGKEPSASTSKQTEKTLLPTSKVT